MGNIVGNNGEVQFANGQSSRDLRDNPDVMGEPIDSKDPRSIRHTDWLKA
jgi:hypothetical protein